MHTKPVDDTSGNFSDWIKSQVACRKCGKYDVHCREWESSCGGYEDYQYRCQSCGASWWVEGCDS